MNKNEIVTIKITDFSNEGDGIGHVDGYALFVKGAVPGDYIEARVLKVKKNFGFAKVEKIIEPSEERINPVCPVSGKCGGCKFNHINYNAELKWKEDRVLNCLTRIGGFSVCKSDSSSHDFEKSEKDLNIGEKDLTVGKMDLNTCEKDLNIGEKDLTVSENNSENNDNNIIFYDIVGSPAQTHYRNKSQFPVGVDKEGNIITGFYAGRTHSIIPIDSCDCQDEVTGEINKTVVTFMKENNISPYDEKNHSGVVRHIMTRVGFSTCEIMVCLIINAKKLNKSDKLVERLLGIDFGEKRITSVCININTEKGNVILGRKTETLYGKSYITDKIGDVSYKISPVSFFQINPVQTRNLYDAVVEFADFKGNETAYDLYCGTGSISLYISKYVKKVVGVEIVPQAIEDAKENAVINGIENAEFYAGAAEVKVPELYEEGHKKADVVIVDPPRKGCDSVLLDTIIKMEPGKIVYVSCDPAT
ncbi:MAG: 23S rRNA (uracil(1939)-C(5))-methyltransferase RlmD, partial [Lachnospiraceae bacterium]|nr:23S rRNA (uracil(1939)-C(5))-methyltransferase RlmD [Lachnospiraceae bacterium]